VVEVQEVLRAWLSGAGARPAAERGGVNVKTARRYIEAAVAAGLVRDGGEGQLSEELLGAVLGAVRPARPDGHGDSWELLVPLQEQISKRVKAGLTVTRIGELLARPTDEHGDARRPAGPSSRGLREPRGAICCTLIHSWRFR